MGKLSTHLLLRTSPRPHKSPYPTRASPHQQNHHKAARTARPLAAAAGARSPGARPRPRLPSTRPRRFRPQLATILEEPEPARGVDRDEDEDRDEDVDMDTTAWDEESTLVAMFQESSAGEDEEAQLLALAEQLRAPMAAHGTHLRRHARDAILPAVQRVKDVHAAIDDKVDVAFGAGILTFDEVCKKVERVALRDEDDLRTVRAEKQASIAKTLEELGEAYARRKALWTTLEDDLERCATRASAALEALSTDMEQTIARWEKKAKTLDKESSGGTVNQRMLQSLLEKM